MLYLIKGKKTGNVIVRTESFFNASYWYPRLPYKENYEFIRIKPKPSAIQFALLARAPLKNF